MNSAQIQELLEWVEAKMDYYEKERERCKRGSNDRAYYNGKWQGYEQSRAAILRVQSGGKA